MAWLILLFCILFVFYVYVGYPALLFFLRRNKRIIVPTNNYVGDISIVMIVCNEEDRVANKIENLLRLNYEYGEKKIIVVDDASTDSTPKILESYSGKIQVINSNIRAGKANGLNLAMKAVQTELVMMVDCRQEIELDALVYLSSWFVNNRDYGAVSGELMFRSEGENSFSEGMNGYWKYEKFIRQSEAIISSVPGVSGAIYMMRTCGYRDLPTDTLLDDVQIPMVLAEQGYRVGYDERAIAWDVPSVSYENEKRRKIRTLSGNYQLLKRFPKWVKIGGHPIWWQFFSHKIARLIAPFMALMTIIPAGYLLSDGSIVAALYLLLFVSFLVLLPLSNLFPFLNQSKLIKLVTSFLSLNWFCLLAFFHYFSGIESGSWKK